jgi:hypothetical protein
MEDGYKQQPQEDARERPGEAPTTVIEDKEQQAGTLPPLEMNRSFELHPGTPEETCETVEIQGQQEEISTPTKQVPHTTSPKECVKPRLMTWHLRKENWNKVKRQ